MAHCELEPERKHKLCVKCVKKVHRIRRGLMYVFVLRKTKIRVLASHFVRQYMPPLYVRAPMEDPMKPNMYYYAMRPNVRFEAAFVGKPTDYERKQIEAAKPPTQKQLDRALARARKAEQRQRRRK